MAAFVIPTANGRMKGKREGDRRDWEGGREAESKKVSQSPIIREGSRPQGSDGS